MTIRLKILLGCLSLTLLTFVLGLYAQDAERKLGGVALDIYDNAFMAVSYLRSAEVEFGHLTEDAHKQGWSAAQSAEAGHEVLTDLEVARERAMSANGRAEVANLQTRIAALLPNLCCDRAGADAVRTAFDRLVEIFAGDAYRYRRGVGHMVAGQIRDSWAAIWVSLVAALAITWLVGRLIAPPVRHAVRVAQSIAAGRLDNPIKARGRGETADLLRALAIMQQSIAAGIARIKSLMDEMAVTHAGEMAAQHAQMDAALSNMTQGLCLFDGQGRLLVANRRFAEMFAPAMPGQTSDEVLEAAGLGMLADAARNGVVESISCELPDGRGIAVSHSAVDGGGWVATYEDVSERRAAEQRLADMARHDQLTGLPNRLLFAEHMRSLLSDDAVVEEGIALLCIDLDRFKSVNDTLGHPAGDALLRVVGQRLRGCTRASDMVVRLGGDEFAIIQQGQPEAATSLAQRVIGTLAEPFEIDGHRICIGGSVGIAVTGETLCTTEALLKSADLALYRAKAEGRGVWRFFEADMDLRMQARRKMEFDLREAVALGQFEVFYQPLMHGNKGISGFEALVRWRHPERGLVGPSDFIPLAEEVGLIPAIGRWVLQRACADAATWPARLKVAVNLSPSQFRGPLVEEVIEALDSSGLSPGLLELEITESIMLADEEQVLSTLHRLRALGARIAMDDFGTGYSSLGYLRRFPFDKIKIDQSFVRNMTDRQDCLAIVRAVIGLGRSLGMSVNAEGVETDDQREALLDEGCLELQGYLFSKPKPASEVAELLRRLGCAAAPHELVSIIEAVAGEQRKEEVLF